LRDRIRPLLRFWHANLREHLGVPTAEKSSLPLVYGHFVATAEFQTSTVDSLATLRSRSGIKVSFLFVQACEDQPESRPLPCMWPACNNNVTLFMPSFQKVLYAHGTSCLVENTWNAMPLREHGSIGLSSAHSSMWPLLLCLFQLSDHTV
jgi:hypothetical protein